MSAIVYSMQGFARFEGEPFSPRGLRSPRTPLRKDSHARIAICSSEDLFFLSGQTEGLICVLTGAQSARREDAIKRQSSRPAAVSTSPQNRRTPKQIIWRLDLKARGHLRKHPPKHMVAMGIQEGTSYIFTHFAWVRFGDSREESAGTIFAGKLNMGLTRK